MGRGTHLSLALLAAVGAFAQTNPAALPAHDSHEGFVVACETYLDAARVKELIGKKNPLEAGILPVEVYFQNSNSQSVRVDLESIQFEITPPSQPRQHLEPLALDYVVDRTLNEQPNPNLGSPRRRLPHPFPSSGRSKKWRELETRLERLSLESGVVPAGAMVHGLLFFDLDGRFESIRYARLYVPGVAFVEGNKPLMFFQVEFGGHD